VVGFAILVPLLLDVDRYRPQVAAQIEQATGKPTQIGALGAHRISRGSRSASTISSWAIPPIIRRARLVKARRIYAVFDASVCGTGKS